MKAYNSRKTPREHILFTSKQRKLSLSQAEDYKKFNGEKAKYIHTGVFKVVGKGEKRIIFSGFFLIRECFDVINKIVMKTKSPISVSNSIRRFERIHKLKISDLGLERKDFFAKNFDIDKIVEKLRIYKGGLNENKN